MGLGSPNGVSAVVRPAPSVISPLGSDKRIGVQDPDPHWRSEPFAFRFAETQLHALPYRGQPTAQRALPTEMSTAARFYLASGVLHASQSLPHAMWAAFAVA